MKISRTIVTILFWLAFLALKTFGIDLDITQPADPEGDGLTLFELVSWILPILAGWFRLKATEKTNLVGVKTGEPLNG